MLKYSDFDIVFQEIPDEVTLAINLSLCPNGCKGCHSPQLQQDIGSELTNEVIDQLLEKYEQSVTCIGLMGGDNDIHTIVQTAKYIHEKSGLKVGWYSGRKKLNDDFQLQWFQYIKLGPYIESFGGLDKKTTNQRLYKIENNKTIDITARMRK